MRAARRPSSRAASSEASEAVTAAEVAAQQVRDAAAEAERELREMAGRLGLEPEPAREPLRTRSARSSRRGSSASPRRREQLGPVNPLAKREYEEAVEHVEELETQRARPRVARSPSWRG